MKKFNMTDENKIKISKIQLFVFALGIVIPTYYLIKSWLEFKEKYFAIFSIFLIIFFIILLFLFEKEKDILRRQIQVIKSDSQIKTK
jgi:cell division protein FtsW (lipid II flippase)